MEKNCCKNCGYCKFIETDNSPGGVMLITNFRCENPESSSHGRVMNSITAHGKTLDSRENNSCDQWTHPDDASREILERAEERQAEAINQFQSQGTSTIHVEQSIGKNIKSKGDVNFSGNRQEVSISDVDDSSSVRVTQSQEGNMLMVSGNKVIINGKETLIPRRIKNAWPNCILQQNGEVYVNGFKYENGNFRRTISSWLKCVFS